MLPCTQPDRPYQPCVRVLVKGLAKEVDDDFLQQIISEFGTIAEYELIQPANEQTNFVRRCYSFPRRQRRRRRRTLHSHLPCRPSPPFPPQIYPSKREVEAGVAKPVLRLGGRARGSARTLTRRSPGAPRSCLCDSGMREVR